MGEYLNQIPEPIQEHIRQITKTSGLGDGDDAVETIAQAWLEKKEIFEKRVEENNLEEADSFEADDPQGALLLTYSGSLVSVGPLVDGSRNVEYASIGLREDVPERAANDESKLAGEVTIDSVAEFDPGPIKKSSAILIIAAPKEPRAPEADEQLLSNVTQVLAEDFVEVNKTIIRG